MLKKIVIFESGSDFAAIIFDVLNSYFGSIFWRKKSMEFFLTNLKTKEKIAEKRKTREETESKPRNIYPVTQNLH